MGGFSRVGVMFVEWAHSVGSLSILKSFRTKNVGNLLFSWRFGGYWKILDWWKKDYSAILDVFSWTIHVCMRVSLNRPVKYHVTFYQSIKRSLVPWNISFDKKNGLWTVVKEESLRGLESRSSGNVGTQIGNLDPSTYLSQLCPNSILYMSLLNIFFKWRFWGYFNYNMSISVKSD